jgi:hypothetical protein
LHKQQVKGSLAQPGDLANSQLGSDSQPYPSFQGSQAQGMQATQLLGDGDSSNAGDLLSGPREAVANEDEEEEPKGEEGEPGMKRPAAAPSDADTIREPMEEEEEEEEPKGEEDERGIKRSAAAPSLDTGLPASKATSKKGNAKTTKGKPMDSAASENRDENTDEAKGKPKGRAKAKAKAKAADSAPEGTASGTAKRKAKGKGKAKAKAGHTASPEAAQEVPEGSPTELYEEKPKPAKRKAKAKSRAEIRASVVAGQTKENAEEDDDVADSDLPHACGFTVHERIRRHTTSSMGVNFCTMHDFTCTATVSSAESWQEPILLTSCSQHLIL